MTPKLQISDLVFHRLKNLKEGALTRAGGLYGLMYSGNLIILGFNLEPSDDKLSFKKIQDNFPTEIDLCGLFKFGECSDAKAHLEDITNNVDITDNPILLKCQQANGDFEIKASQWKNGKLEEIEHEYISEEMIYDQFIMTRLKGYIEIIVELNEKSIKHEFQAMRKKMAYGNVIFQLEEKNVFFNNNEILGLSNMESVMADLLKKSDISDNLKKNKKEVSVKDFRFINIECLIKKSDEFDKKQRSALNFTLEKNKILLPISIDALAALHINTKTVALFDILVESLCRNLRSIEENIIEQLETGGELVVPMTYHYKPDGFGHFYSCVYPQSTPDEDGHLTETRRDLHQLFSLSTLRPTFRKANSYQFNKSNLLINPHAGLKSSVVGGKQYLVQGKYTYHHYMQDKFDDNGWGCAYRSLQTLFSWFRFQGYSDQPVPSHSEIQGYLVKVGDKPKGFLNSKQWIGSTEVSMCLQGFINVDSKIMHVSTGAELSSKGSELAYHFETQGTPLMIGGGSLAHTILGVDFNSNTGELKFLILDPHYTGADDLTEILSKGWCGWKGSNFWQKDVFYNLCMPQRPILF